MRLEKNILAAVLMLATLAGCVTYPISENLQKQARPLTIAQVTANPDAAMGTTVIWGGKIITTVNDTNGGSIYVLKLPLDPNERPQPYVMTTGRFIATSTGFLDPEAYPRGRLVTLAGQISGVASEPVQKVQYTYPVLTIEQIHVWPVQPREYYYYNTYPDWYWDYPYWYGGAWYYPGWYGGYRGGYHGGGWGGGFHAGPSGGGFHGGGH